MGTVFSKNNSQRSAQVLDFDKFTEEEFKQHPLIIVCASTHYEGDPCDNTKKFYRWLRDARKNKAENS